MTKHKDRASTPAHLRLLGNGTSEPFIGVHEVPGRLPVMLRYPGESAEAFSKRALHQLDGEGACWARLMYASETAAQQPSHRHHTGSVPSWAFSRTGHSRPEPSPVSGFSDR